MANRVSVEISANVQGFQQGMNQATDSAQKYETETRKVADAQVNLMKELKAAKREVQNLAAGYAKLDDEAKKSAFGQEMARQLEEAKRKAAEYIDLQGDLNTELKNMASDTATFDTLADGLSALGSTMSAVTGVMGIFTDDTELMTKAVTYFTTAESIASAAIKVKNLLQKQSSLMLGISRVQQMASTAAVELDTVAKGKNAVATGAATVAQKALNAAAKANPYILLASAVLAVVSALALFTSGSEDAERAQTRLNNRLAEGTQRALEYNNAMYSAAQAVVNFLSQTGAASWEIENAKIKAEEEQVRLLSQQYLNLKRAKGESVEDYEKREKEAYDKLKTAQDNLIKVKNEVKDNRRAVQQLLDTWESLKTEKQINAAISAFRNLRSEYVQGSKEYNEMTRRIEILQKRLNPTKTTGPKRSTGNTKQEIEAAVGSIAALEKEISELQERAKKGALPEELNDPTKYAAELKRLQSQLKELKIKWGFEKPDNKLKELEAEVEKAKAEFVIAVDSDDMQAQRAAYQAYQTAQKKLDDYKLSIELKPEIDESTLAKQAADIQEKVSNALNPKTELSATYNFSGLGNFEDLEKFQKPAQDVIDAMKRIEDARKELTEVMNASDATDTQIAAAQKGLEELNGAYNELAKKADVYKELSDAADDLARHNENMARSLEFVGSALQNVGNIMSSIATISGDKVFNAVAVVAQAVATYILGWSEATAKAAKMGPLGWLAFGLSTGAQMLAMVAQIKSVTKSGFAEGGIVPGSSYAGDRLYARVNSGEMILNQRQQRNLFNLLDGDSINGRNEVVVGGEVRIKGSDLYLSMKNYSKGQKLVGKNTGII